MKKFKSALTALLGSACFAFAVSVFLVPNKIVGGGLSGIATMLYHTASVPTAVTLIIANILLLILGITVLGKSFIFKTLGCVAFGSVFTELFSHIPPITDNVLLATIFGGIIYGFGLGLTFSQDASNGGTDILSRILQHFFPHMAIGKLLLLIDGCIIFASYLIFKNTELALFGIITMAISSFAIDYLIRKLNISKLAFVISDKGAEIAKNLVSTSPRGVTVFNVVGGYTGENKTMLMCAIKDREMPSFQKKIDAIDENAFTIFSESQQIIGNGFHLYR